MVKRRLDMNSLTAEEVLRRGIAAARVGDDDEARALLSEVTLREPDNEAAWLWLAGVETGPQRKRAAFERVLALKPDDEEATDGLECLAEKYGAAILKDDEGLETLRCTWHADRETLLRCARCDKPMCPECSRQHPVGLRCKECMRETRSPLYKVSTARYFAAGLTAVAAGSAAALILAAVFGLVSGFLTMIIGFLAGGILGTPIAEAVSVSAGRKRGRGLVYAAAAGMVLGVAVAGVVSVFIGGLFMSVLGFIAYLFAGIGAVRVRLR